MKRCITQLVFGAAIIFSVKTVAGADITFDFHNIPNPASNAVGNTLTTAAAGVTVTASMVRWNVRSCTAPNRPENCSSWGK